VPVQGTSQSHPVSHHPVERIVCCPVHGVAVAEHRDAVDPNTVHCGSELVVAASLVVLASGSLELVVHGVAPHSDGADNSRVNTMDRMHEPLVGTHRRPD
jgi:hypothetical protein